MKEGPNIMRFFTILVWAAIIFMIVVSSPLWAQECRGNQPCTDSSVSVAGGDTSVANHIGGNDSLALGFGGADFDVDIAQCLASRSRHWLFGAYADQKLTQNLHCMGLAYMAAGMPEAAKYVLCDAENAPLAGMPDCPGIIEKPATEAPAASGAMLDHHIEREERHEDLLMTAQMEIQDLKERIANVKPQIIYRNDPGINAELRADAERRAKTRAILEGQE